VESTIFAELMFYEFFEIKSDIYKAFITSFPFDINYN
jgi:hypothetical protein